MQPAHFPTLCQVNTRTSLTALSRALGRPATLDDVPDAQLDRLAQMGFDWVWLLSVWQTGLAGQKISRSNPQWRREFQETLPDLREEDITGSGFAIAGYTVHRDFGGDAELARLRERLRSRGLRLMLDFVPNHTALDHNWVEDHPEYYIEGTELDLVRTPHDYTWVKRRNGDMLFAYGRDPNFPGWPDALQLNYGNAGTQEAMIGELLKIAGQCDGVRCDMAMLVLPEVFERTWKHVSEPFWQKAIARARERVPGFCFMAEAYWDLEWTLQQQGFDYTYDKRLYDRLRDGNARPVRDHFHAESAYQNKLARFLENHDEPRAAATFPLDRHRAAAALTFFSPGLHFFHQGQLEGYVKRISPHLARGPNETANPAVAAFYERVLAVLRRDAIRRGEWRLLECDPAFDGDGSSDSFIACLWRQPGGECLLVAVNCSARRSKCFVRLQPAGLVRGKWRLRDLLGDAIYERDGDDLNSRGLYLDVPAWQAHAFEVSPS